MSFGVGEQFVNSQIADRKLEETRKAAAPKTNIEIFATKDTNKDKSLDISEHKLAADDFQLGSQEFITPSIVEKAEQILTNLLKTLKIEYTPKTVEMPVSDGNSDEVDVNSLAIVNNARKEVDKNVENLINNRKNQVLQELQSRIDGSVSAKRSTIIDWSPASRVNLGEEWRGNRYTDEGLADLKEAVSTMEQPSDLLEYYLKQHSAELQGKTSVSDYDERLMTDFVQNNPSIIRDGAIASNAKLDKLDFPSISSLISTYAKEAEPVTRISDEEAVAIGKAIHSIADDKGYNASAKGMRDYIELNINADNVAEVVAFYDSAQSDDSSIIDTFSSEWLSEDGEGGGRDNAYQATMHIINSLKTRAASLPADKKGEGSAVGNAIATIDNAIRSAKYNDWIKGDDLTSEVGDDDDALTELFEDPIATLATAILDAEQGEIAESEELAEAPANGNDPDIKEEYEDIP